jgi:hypothetical protein
MGTAIHPLVTEAVSSLHALSALSGFSGPSKLLPRLHKAFSTHSVDRPGLAAGPLLPPLAATTVPTPASARNVKSNAGNMQCDICGIPFLTAQGLKRHRDSKHFNLTPFTCHVCGRGFTMKGHYEGHMNMHNNVKSFQCQRCPRAFAHRSSLRFHLRNSLCGKEDSSFSGPTYDRIRYDTIR